MDFRGKNIDLVGKFPLWFGLSAALLLVGMISWGLFGLNLGIDFRGGSQFTYRIPAQVKPADSSAEVALISQVNKGLEDAGIIGARTQVAGGNDLVVQTTATTDSERSTQERITNGTVAKVLKLPTIAPEGRDFVGAVIGNELRRNAVWGVLVGVFFIALWIFIRYNFAGEGLRYAVAGVTALIHDVFVLIGMFALIGHIDHRIEIDSTFIAALLTVVGYSINDSVVIFDRLRENLRNRRRDTYEKVVNDSLLETMSRSINTGLTVLIMLFIMLMFGGGAIYNFTLAMLLGIASGLYSSIFNASMVLVAWHRWDEKRAGQLKARRLTTPSVTVRETSRSGAIKPRSK